MSTTVHDRRIEEREPAAGEVHLLVLEPMPMEIRAHLLDVSRSGFRASHMYPALSSGQHVRFRHSGGQAVARVCWNRIFDEHVETGFFVLPA